MRVLIDAHALIWAVDQPSRLGGGARAALLDPASELLLSAGSVWEIAIKVALKKLTLSLPYCDWMNGVIDDLGLSMLAVTVAYADRQASLPWHHRDPFDRLLIAQAAVESVPVVTADAVFDLYGVTRIWD